MKLEAVPQLAKQIQLGASAPFLPSRGPAITPAGYGTHTSSMASETTLDYSDLVLILHLFGNQSLYSRHKDGAVATESQEALPNPPFVSRPAFVSSAHSGNLYVEGDEYSRRKAFMGYKCQLWKSSGGRKGSTVITNGSGRTFIRKYGKIQSNSTVPVQLRYHQYVEVDKKTQLECGPRVFFIPKRLSRSKPNGSADPGLALGGRGARPAANLFASRSVCRALLTSQVNPGSLYRCK